MSTTVNTTVIPEFNFAAILEFFNSGMTYQYNFRKTQLLKLRNVIKKYETQLIAALKTDLGKPELEAYVSEVAIVYNEINYALKHLKSWMRKEKVSTPLSLFYSTSYVYKVPLGVVLIIAPWNYPVQLLLTPLIGAIAAGNCAVLKPSELVPATSHLLKTIITEVFDCQYINIIEGDGVVVVPNLINDYPFNHVFFTGSTTVGKSIAVQCAAKLIPYTLELGGKSPAIVDKDVDLDVACKRILWGKWFNAGQTCIAPDYILVHQDIKSDLITRLKYHLDRFLEHGDMAAPSISSAPSLFSSYTSILNYKRMHILQSYLEGLNVIYGGAFNSSHLKFMPTIVDEPPLIHKIMQEEIFGPILPILSYADESQLRNIISHNPNPLALYVFSTNQDFIESMLTTISFGGGCVNTTLMHLVNLNLPFGGVGNSGQGKYCGKYSFDTFSYQKAIVKMATWFDAFIKYPPYTKLKLSLLKLL
jgi:aldehyde dehydrogenase (NAD+)